MKTKMTSLVAITAMSTLGLMTQAHANTPIKACVWDIMGTTGDVYTHMKDYALAAKTWGADITLKSYTDERVATEDFKAGQCDLVAITGMRGKQFNKFTGSADAVGAVPNAKTSALLMKFIADPKLASKMTVGQYEVAGVTPVGGVFLFVNDRKIDTIAKAAGKKVAVLDYDKSQAKLVQRLGAQPVNSEITNFASKFNNSQVDIIAAPALAFKPLELAKGLGTKGGIARLPIINMTGNVIIRASKFPDGYGQKSRTWIAQHQNEAVSLVAKSEAGIPAKYWMEIPAADQVGYVKLMRDARIDLTKDGYYDAGMMKLLKKIRCQVDPSSFECALNDE